MSIWEKVFSAWAPIKCESAGCQTAKSLGGAPDTGPTVLSGTEPKETRAAGVSEEPAAKGPGRIVGSTGFEAFLWFAVFQRALEAGDGRRAKKARRALRNRGYVVSLCLPKLPHKGTPAHFGEASLNSED